MAELMQELNSFTGWLLIASLKSLPLIAILLLAQYWLKNYLSAGARHGLWLSLFLCLSIPFGWHFSFDIRSTELLFSSANNNATSRSGSEIITSPTAAAEISQTNIENDLYQPPKHSNHFAHFAQYLESYLDIYFQRVNFYYFLAVISV